MTYANYEQGISGLVVNDVYRLSWTRLSSVCGCGLIVLAAVD